MKIVESIVELIRETSSSLPEDVLKALRAAQRRERKGSSAAVVLKTILDNCAIAKKRGTPLCQDTGTLTFFVDESLRRKVTPAVLKRAVAIATERGYLRKNTIDAVTGKSYDDNVCDGAPVVHYRGSASVGLGSASVGLGSASVGLGSASVGPGSSSVGPGSSSVGLGSSSVGLGSASVGLGIGSGEVGSKDARNDAKRPYVTLILKGGGSENMSRQYSLPDASLGAGRDLEGVRKCILDAVQKIQGYGCAPGILGVCIGGDRATGYEVAKEQLLRPLDEECSNVRMSECLIDEPCAKNQAHTCNQTLSNNQTIRQLRSLEKRLLKEANSLGIGPMGLGGKTTLLGVKVAARPRVPASFFVTIAYMCWACRRRTLVLSPSVGCRSLAVEGRRQGEDKRQPTADKRGGRRS